MIRLQGTNNYIKNIYDRFRSVSGLKSASTPQIDMMSNHDLI